MVQEIKYLGIRIRTSGVFTRGVADLSNKAYAKTKVSDVIHLSRTFDACVKPILLYCCEVWSPYIMNLDKNFGEKTLYIQIRTAI